ncbi:MAG TPA: AmiS/UreI family transporter [Nocardioides sp.]|nr:AmiS/UreI family transporter [Nocardioides sp.]
MSAVGLLFVGAVLFVNGLLFLGKVDARSAGVFNLFVGALQTAIPFWLLAHATSSDQVLGAAGIFLFGFTYLYVGIGNLAGLPGDGLGWYAAWVSVLAAGFGVVNIVRFHDTPTGLLWLQWSVLWAAFWVVLALGVTRLTTAAGWLTLIQSVTTCTVPGFIILLGKWGEVPAWSIALTIVASAAVVVPIALRSPAEPAQAEPERVEAQPVAA